MKKIVVAILIILLMFVEYRYIMTHITPSVDNGTIYLEVFGQVDEYTTKAKGD